MLELLFKLLRLHADVRAVSRGPKAMAKRAGRRAGHAAVRRLFR